MPQLGPVVFGRVGLLKVGPGLQSQFAGFLDGLDQYLIIYFILSLYLFRHYIILNYNRSIPAPRGIIYELLRLFECWVVYAIFACLWDLGAGVVLKKSTSEIFNIIHHALENYADFFSLLR